MGLILAFQSWLFPLAHEDDLKALEGVWELTELQPVNPALCKELVEKIVFVVKDERLTMKGPHGAAEYTLRLNPAVSPKSIDLTWINGPSKGKTAPAVYEVSGATLKLCIANHHTGERPKHFKPAEKPPVHVFVMKRATK